MPEIFAYFDYRQFLKDAMAAMKAVRPAFTYRFIAGKVGMKSPGHITWIIQGKRNLSEKKILPFAQILGLNERATKFFTALVHFNQASTHLQKKEYLDELVSLQGSEKALIKPISYEFYKKWYYSAVRELVATNSLDDDFKRIAHLVYPPITPREAQQAIALLVKLNFIRKDAAGRYVQVKQAISTGEAWRSVAVRQFQMDTFDLAKGALDKVAAAERDISTLTMSISEESFTRICHRIKQFRNELVTIVTADKNPARVYQMNIALFPLSSREASHE
jgi:uncharacterized protein (TIGR02147 family)